MSSGTIPVFGSGLKYDTNATANSVPLRDGSGGLTNGPEAMTQITCSGSVSFKYNSQTSSYAITWGASGDHLILADTTGGSITLTLPSPAAVSGGGLLRVIRKSASNVLTIAPNGAEKINGTAANKTVATTANLILEIWTDGTDWYAGSQTVI